MFYTGGVGVMDEAGKLRVVGAVPGQAMTPDHHQRIVCRPIRSHNRHGVVECVPRLGCSAWDGQFQTGSWDRPRLQ